MMPDKLSVIESLKRSKKGQLNYDRNWANKPSSIQETIELCTAPPTLSWSPKSSGDSNTNTPCKIEECDRSLPMVEIDGSPQLSKSVKKTHRNSGSLHTSPYLNMVNNAITEYDKKTEDEKNIKIAKREQLFEDTTRDLAERTEQHWISWDRRQSLETKVTSQNLLADDVKRNRDVRNRQEKDKERLKKHAQHLDARMKEAEAKKRQIEEEEQKRVIEAQKRLSSVLEKAIEFEKIQEEITNIFNNSSAKNAITERGTSALKLLLDIKNGIDRETANSQSKGATNENVSKMGKYIEEVLNIKKYMVSLVETAEKNAKVEATKSPPSASTDQPGATSTGDEVLCISKEGFMNYSRVTKYRSDILNSYQNAFKDVSLKKYRFDLQKAVNTPVNAISPTSGAHLRDKLLKLHAILSGKQIEIGGKRVCAADHPAGIPFVRDTFAIKIVKQGDEQISSNFESAFALAAVTVGVWKNTPEVGDLILAHFYKACPYLVPYYIPKGADQTTQDHYKALGYNYEENGEIEEQGKFLKRMSGLMRLYASIIVSSTPDKSENPHGIEFGWKWLTETLNLEPRPSITATMMFDFLEVTASSLHKAYGKQFVKLIDTILGEYIEKIKKVTPPGSGGPVVRLEQVLQKWLKSREITPPKGMLHERFWNT